MTIAAALTAFTAVSAQSIDEDVKFYDEGPLTWNDFTTGEFDSSDWSRMGIVYKVSTEKQKFGNLKVHRYVARTGIDKFSTWVKKDAMTEANLKYCRLIFDISELTRRKMQAEIDANRFNYSNRDILDYYHNQNNSRIELIKDESGSGARKDIVERRLADVASQLGSDPTDSLPAYTLRRFGYGMHCGLETNIYTGIGGKYLRPSVQFIYGFELNWKKSSFFIDLGLGSGKVGNDLMFYGTKRNEITEVIWAAGESYQVAQADIIYGYPVIDNDYIKVLPMAGVGINTLSNKLYDTENSSGMGGLHLMAGVTAAWKFSRRLTLAPAMLSYNEYTEGTLRLKAYVARHSYMDGFNPITVNFALTVSLSGRMIRR